jgi:hypothetical protein
MSNKDAPHQAVILVKIEMMERLPNGQVSGRPVYKNSKLLSVVGKSYDECMNNLQELLHKMGINDNESK